MAKLTWSERDLSYGVSKGVLYGEIAYPWQGLVSVVHTEEEVSNDSIFLDGFVIRRKNHPGEIQGTVEAYYPPMGLNPNEGFFREFDPAFQRRRFGFSYQAGGGIYIVYNAAFVEGEREYSSIAEEIEPLVHSWEFTTIPVHHPGLAPASMVYIDLSGIPEGALTDLEGLLYGTDTTDPTLPELSDLADFLDERAIFRVVLHGDGTWSAIGPDEYINVVGDLITFTNVPTLRYLDADTYEIESF